MVSDVLEAICESKRNSRIMPRRTHLKMGLCILPEHLEVCAVEEIGLDTRKMAKQKLEERLKGHLQIKVCPTQSRHSNQVAVCHLRWKKNGSAKVQLSKFTHRRADRRK